MYSRNQTTSTKCQYHAANVKPRNLSLDTQPFAIL